MTYEFTQEEMQGMVTELAEAPYKYSFKLLQFLQAKKPRVEEVKDTPEKKKSKEK